ncbi:MAG: LacI family DNA-binding transcriptional regulator [Lachnospiraceae bacterium]|nr:LacI family DNA-binding transcriptional regulator [Lachnospiraceae bacterium]
MAKIKSAPTMKDVARESGVALGTVSKVINGIPVGESYRIRVEEAIKKLNYRVNNYAKGLKSNHTNTIAVIVPNLINPFFGQLVHYINVSLSEAGYQMLVCSTDFNPVTEQNVVIMAEQKKVDGIICLSYNPDLQVSEDIPFVSIDRYFGDKIPCITSDNYAGGMLAARQLINNGCKNIAFLRIGSPLSNETNKRSDGFVSECTNSGVNHSLKILNDGDSHQQFMDFLKDHYKDGKLEFDGIFCVTDWLEHIIEGMLKELGLTVPEDVQLIGFDGIRRFGDMEYCCSTIVQQVDKIASTCVEMVLKSNRENLPTLVCLPVQYAYGGTTKDK